MSWKPAKAQVAKVGKQMGCHLCLVTFLLVVGQKKNGRIFLGWRSVEGLLAKLPL